MLRWIRNSALLCGFMGPPDDYTRIVNHPYAKAATGDQMVEGAIIECIIKHFEKWSTQGHHLVWPLQWVLDDGRQRIQEIKLINRTKNIECVATISWEYERQIPKDSKSGAPLAGYLPKLKSFTVNGIEMPLTSANKIFTAYVKLRDQIREAERIAAECLRQQELEQKKWDLAETLLGLRE